MDSILVFNVGSSSIRYHRYTVESFELLHSGHVPFDIPLESQDELLKIFRDCLRDIGDISSIKGIGHRMVHGGEVFIEPMLVTPGALEKLKSLAHLAPLHNPWNIAGIEACRTYLPNIPNVAVFDTSFFAPLPLIARTYALPRSLARYRRFGFHGISHSSVADRVSQKLKTPLGKLSFISCHLGSGCSIAVIECGMPVDISMGFTPLEGLVMMTRSGDVDPGIIFNAIRTQLATAHDIEAGREMVAELESSFYQQAGLHALAGVNSYQELLERMRRGDQTAAFAFQVFVRRIRKYIGAYATVVKKLDAICFTGAIGAGDPVTRKAILKDLNGTKGIRLFTFESEEELAIAKEVKKILVGK